MDWFRTDSDLPRHPQVLRLARTLGVSKVEAIGHMTCLWCAVAEHAEDGALDIADAELIELWAEWPESRRGHFVVALQAVGWVDSNGMLKGWAERHEYMLRERKRKQDDRRKWREEKDKRKRTARAASDGECAPSPPDGAPHRTVPYRTVPDSTSELPTTSVADPATPTATKPKRDPAKTAAVIAWWNELAGRLKGLISCRSLDKATERAAAHDAHDTIMANLASLEDVLSDPFYRGQGRDGWQADLRYVIRNGTLTKLLERATSKPPSEDLALDKIAREWERENGMKLFSGGQPL